MNRRHDRISAMFIEAVLDASRHHGTARAARLLHEDGVAFDVALRVLTRPGGRRLAPPSSACAGGGGSGRRTAVRGGASSPSRRSTNQRLRFAPCSITIC